MLSPYIDARSHVRAAASVRNVPVGMRQAFELRLLLDSVSLVLGCHAPASPQKPPPGHSPDAAPGQRSRRIQHRKGIARGDDKREHGGAPHHRSGHLQQLKGVIRGIFKALPTLHSGGAVVGTTGHTE